MAAYLITSLLSLVTKLLPSITASAHTPSSSSSDSNNSERGRARAVEEDLERLMRTLKRIKATLYDAEEKEIIDRSTKLWIKELKKVAYDAKDVLSEYQYELTRLQVEARKVSHASGSHKGKQMEYIVPIFDGMVDRLNKIISRFDEIAKDREALQLKGSDGPRRPNSKTLRSPTSHMVDEASIFGRGAEITKVINFLLSEKEKENTFSVISIVGKGGLGKTTIAQLVYKDGRVSGFFDLFGWVCVSEEFDVGRLTKAIIESVSNINYGLSELSPLQEGLAKIVNGKSILLVLDDVWNENQTLWELFQVPLKEAKMVRILVTTRNKKVAEVMQTKKCFSPTNLPEDSCWQLFQHYAFSGTSDIMQTDDLVDMGRDITRKCGGLPLVVKSIASLLRYERDEEGWREILESDLWESNPLNDIFPALQISYAHLPAHLKPCFLFCSMYPKDYILEKMNLIELWISHGYIEPRGKRKITEIGVGYYEELKQRSFLDNFSNDSAYEYCKLHDIIHDLARLNSENEHYSVEINRQCEIQGKNVPQEAYHLYVRSFINGYVNQILQQNVNGLRTLSVDFSDYTAYSGHKYNRLSNLTKFEALRVLELKGNFNMIPDFMPQFKHLTYLYIKSPYLKTLPLSIGLLYNLQTLIINCSSLYYPPESIGDLANLQYLNIESDMVKRLPKSLCSLSNLLRLVVKCYGLEEVPLDLRNLRNLRELTLLSKQTLALPNTIGCLSSLEKLNFSQQKNYSLGYVPHGIVSFPAIKKMAAKLRVRNLAWLKDMKDLEGRLSIEGLDKISNLVDAQCANLRNKCKLKALDLCWDYDLAYDLLPQYDFLPADRERDLMRLRLRAEASEDRLVGANDVDFSLLECLQPHPNLKTLLLRYYPSATLPEWMGDPFSLQSIQEVTLEYCHKIQSLPFSTCLHTLKHVIIRYCSKIRVLRLEQLPSRLEKMEIAFCDNLELITGLGDPNMLAALEINSCSSLKSITMDELHLVESTKPFGEKPHIGRQNISLLTKLTIKNCYSHAVLPNSNFHTLKYLNLYQIVGRIQVLQLEQLFSQLKVLHIIKCDQLESITGLGNMHMLAVLEICECPSLKSLMMDELQLSDMPHIGRQRISSLKRLRIFDCKLLRVLPDGLIPSGPCHVWVHDCGCPDLMIN